MRLPNLPAFLIVAAVLAAPISASADTIGPWSLNATLCGGPPMPSCFGGPWGSVSISDSADAERVDVTVSLVNPARVSDVYLNFDDQFFSSGDLTFTMLAYIGTVFETVNASFNGEKVDGYKTLVDNGTYDLHIPFNSTRPSLAAHVYSLQRGRSIRKPERQSIVLQRFS